MTPDQWKEVRDIIALHAGWPDNSLPLGVLHVRWLLADYDAVTAATQAMIAACGAATAARLNAMSTRIDATITGVDPQDILGADRLLDAINLAAELENRSPQQLVDLALQFAPADLPRTYEAIVDELCSRVHAGWERDENSPAAVGTDPQQHLGSTPESGRRVNEGSIPSGTAGDSQHCKQCGARCGEHDYCSERCADQYAADREPAESKAATLREVHQDARIFGDGWIRVDINGTMHRVDPQTVAIRVEETDWDKADDGQGIFGGEREGDT